MSSVPPATSSPPAGTSDHQGARRALFFIFTLSGFAGLIYESIWSHYLKLLLGHAAYAQTLVLLLFMGGMAIGAFLCGQVSHRIRRPLLAYAAVELVLGVMALGFDPVFRSVFDWVLNDLAPSIGDPALIEAAKWGLASLLILPACVLLGATFPLISAGVLRLDPRAAGNTLGWLYFTNSLGATAGVLTSGFVLIEWVGLPGTLLTAGLCNFLLALSTYVIGARRDTPSQIAAPSRDPASNALGVTAPLLLATAFITGAASFMYEMGWIRMLSLVLGSATHSFELMLGAFILGIALGSLWIRNRIDTVRDPLRTLAWVQVLMGVAALCSLVVYGWSFDWMGAMVKTLAKSDTGYTWFNFMSQAICWALMLPVTVFAGMTLPLITALVLRSSGSEGAIGRVYAANTVGSIVGVVLAMHLVMPLLGLRNVVVIGAALDLGLGLWLLMRAGGSASVLERTSLITLMSAATAIIVLVHFDPSRLASGVYRHGSSDRHANVIFHRDGRSASIDVTKAGDTISILTNGKPDASLSPTRVTPDDYTMILTGALPLAIRPEAKTVALIGMGSGRSTHTFLASPALQQVDTIEIEPAMVEGARYFGPLVARAFDDPRSHIHSEDAKTFFARHQKQYDIIMSEPSNPWVSGVASLFGQEFYRQIKHHMAPGGLFVQWLQLYEFDDSLVATVGLALGEEFSDYAIYLADNSNILVVAVAEGKVPNPTGAIFGWPDLKNLSHKIGIQTAADLDARWLANKAVAGPFFDSAGVPANSDYFPYLDQHAAKYRFLSQSANGLVGAHSVTQRLAGKTVDYSSVTEAPLVTATKLAAEARELIGYIEAMSASEPAKQSTMRTPVITQALALTLIRRQCTGLEVSRVWIPSLLSYARTYWPYLSPVDATRLVTLLRDNVCTGDIQAQVSGWLDLLEAIAHGNWSAVSAETLKLLGLASNPGDPASEFIARELLLANQKVKGSPEAVAAVALLGAGLRRSEAIRFLQAVSGSGLQ